MRRSCAFDRHEAFVYHDDTQRLSMVTVGLFDHTAVDPQSGIHSPDVSAVLDEFPIHLVNGEPLKVPIDPRRPKLGSAPQSPKLVLVPRK